MSNVLSRCSTCGFHYASELPSDNQLEQYYSTLSKYDSQPSVSAVDRERIEYAINFFGKCEIPKRAAIVDIGCGFGALLASLRSRGWKNLQGTDPAPGSSREASAQFGLDCVKRANLAATGEVVDLPSVDVVCLMAVLEHLPSLRKDLEKLIRQMRSGAYILIEVPALELFDGRNGEPYGELSIEHLQYFCLESLQSLFGTLGATVLAHQLDYVQSARGGSLFALAQIGSTRTPIIKPEASAALMETYLNQSAEKWTKSLQLVPREPFVIYGAGSHSGRLLADLSEAQRNNVLTVVDGNRNLIGRKIGKWQIQPPAAINAYPDNQVLISSFRAESGIASALKTYPNTLVRLYGNEAT